VAGRDYFAEYDDQQLLDFVNNRFPQMMAQAVAQTAFVLWGNVKEEAPVDEGRLHGSFQITQMGTLSWAITSNAEYRWIVNNGRGEIIAKPGHTLRFEVGGQVIYRKRVRAAKANPFYDRAIAATEGEIPNIIDRVLEGGM